MIKKKCHEALIEPNDVSLIFSYEVPKNCIRRVFFFSPLKEISKSFKFT